MLVTPLGRQQRLLYKEGACVASAPDLPLRLLRSDSSQSSVLERWVATLKGIR
jgi:hypothetical protein